LTHNSLLTSLQLLQDALTHNPLPTSLQLLQDILTHNPLLTSLQLLQYALNNDSPSNFTAPAAFRSFSRRLLLLSPSM
jgi:hypothetical protein